MFDSLADRLQSTLAGVRARGTLSEDDLKASLREIRLALLEADVNVAVVKTFTNAVRERALGADLVGKLNPSQQIVKIVHEELAALMGGVSRELKLESSSGPAVVLMVGLQGSGKTTTTAKLARWLKNEQQRSVALAACDLQRPAAVDQLVTVGGQVGVSVYQQGVDGMPVACAQWALEQAKRDGHDVLIVDTAGRLHIDDALMDELKQIRQAVKPTAILLVVDAMVGQDAVAVAQGFSQQIGCDGTILTKLDGDARGGVALSVASVTNAPILFASTGEKLGQFDRFHPDRMAQRILGMGDVLSLVERAERQIDEDQAKELERKIRQNRFTLEDFLSQLKMVRRMGPLGSLLKMIPGLGGQQLANAKIDERELDRIEAMILSMTPHERAHPEIIKGSRRIRVAHGSGTSPQQVARLLKQFDQMRKVMRQVSQGKMPNLGSLMR